MMRTMMLALGLLAGSAATVLADTLPERYFDSMSTLRARFVQIVHDAAGRVIEESAGTVLLQKPGRFRWDYETPFPQLIVADGEYLWHFDSDLDQVTVKDMDEVLGTAPMALLTDGQPLAASFRVVPAGAEPGVRWFGLEPRSGSEVEFQALRVGFAEDGGLAAMELRDFLDQRTVLRFHDVERDVELDPELFRFEPPPGVDVLGMRP